MTRLLLHEHLFPPMITHFQLLNKVLTTVPRYERILSTSVSTQLMICLDLTLTAAPEATKIFFP